MPHSSRLIALFLSFGLAACTDSKESDDPTGEDGLALLGSGSHDSDSISLERILSDDDDLDQPSDLAINPVAPDQLWVTNYGSDSIVVMTGYGTDDADADRYKGSSAQHFLAQPMGLAFTGEGDPATIHDTDDFTQGSNGTPEDFMGPTLWEGDLDDFDGGHGSHLDMLHNSPLGGGIAWEENTAFWVFDGYHQAISRYDFGEDHGQGGSDHGDGEIRRYVEGQVDRIEGAPSALVFDHDSALLYIADTASGNVVVLDTTSGETGSNISPNYDGCSQKAVDDAELWTLVDGAELGDIELTAPSGMALHDGVLYVGDNDAGRILAFDLDGELIDWVDLDVEAGGLAGLEVDANGNLLYVDMADESVWRIAR